MSDNASPLQWTGNKGCIYTTIDAFMPPHKTYIEPCMGSAEIFLRKKPTEREILNDYNGDLNLRYRITNLYTICHSYMCCSTMSVSD